MENKKLLKFLLKDLSELEELVAEKENNSFSELEMEFLQTRVSGAKRMIQILFDRENSSLTEKTDEPKNIIPKKVEVQGEIIEEKTEPEIEEKFEESEIEIREEVEDALDRIADEVDKTEEIPDIEIKENLETSPEIIDEKEVELDKKKVIAEANQRLGDSFLKEKLVNDLIDTENTKLEHKLSNRPVESIKTAIGINDRFQYIRELFEGNAEIFSNAVAELDAKKDIKEAVEYLQQNFKWKKNETSLKFVNLVKRRFNND